MMQDLFEKLTARVTEVMRGNDGSHDMTHIQRVIRNVECILRTEQAACPGRKYDGDLVRFGALMHDVGDHKYATPGQDVTRAVYDLILSAVNNPEEYRDFAEKVQAIATGVSYTQEMKDPKKTADLIAKIPELAIQDADRLDSTGAVGIGRTLTYHGAHESSNQSAREVIENRMMTLKNHMKTETGRKLAEKTTERMRIFKEWWDEETSLDGA